MANPKITKARITAMPRTSIAHLDPMPTVFVTTEDGTEVELFSYYPDELTFTEDEFLGLTVEEARALRHRKDVDFLREPECASEEGRPGSRRPQATQKDRKP